MLVRIFGLSGFTRLPNHPLVRAVAAMFVISGWLEIAVFLGIVFALLVFGDALARIIGAVLLVTIGVFLWRSRGRSTRTEPTGL